MQTRSQTRAMDFGQRWHYEEQFRAQLEYIHQPIKCTLLDGREFTFEGYYFTWVDIRDGQRKYLTATTFYSLTTNIAEITGISQHDQILFNTDTGERLNDAYYESQIMWWVGDIPRDVANVLVMSK